MKTIKLLSSMLFVAGMAMSTVSFGQVKIGTNPATIDAANNLEVEASTAGRSTSINKTSGQVTIKDGTEAEGKILTSDANGVASWQNLADQKIPTTVWIGEQTGNYTVTPSVSVVDPLKDRIPLVPRTGSIAGYDATTKLYTIQESGYYRIFIGASITGSSVAPPISSDFVRLYLGMNGSYGTFSQYNGITAIQNPLLTAFWEGYFLAGATYNIFINTVAGTQNMTVNKCFMSVTKL